MQNYELQQGVLLYTKGGTRAPKGLQQKRRIMVDEQLGDTDNLAVDQGRLNVLKQEYQIFSKKAGLRTEVERLEVAQLYTGAKDGPKQTRKVNISAVNTRNDSHNSIEQRI